MVDPLSEASTASPCRNVETGEATFLTSRGRASSVVSVLFRMEKFVLRGRVENVTQTALELYALDLAKQITVKPTECCLMHREIAETPSPVVKAKSVQVLTGLEIHQLKQKVFTVYLKFHAGHYHAEINQS